MKYPRSYLDEIKQRIKVSDIVSSKVKLKKRGKEFIGLSPFKNEKTPSFTVNDEKEFYHCFSTGEHGNIFDFVIKMENLSFGEAVKLLAKKAGMREFTFSKQDIVFENKKKKIQEIFTFFFKHCHELIKTKYINSFYEYLIKRGIQKETINLFEIGYCENNSEVLNKLKRNNFSDEEILETGLFFKKENNYQIIPRFYNRIIFPIKNYYNDYIGCGGRILDNTKFAKYINTPETLLYKKGENLFNYNLSRKLFGKYEDIFLVEGYMDVINFYDKGVENVAGILGTAITVPQIKLAWKNFKNIIICFDGDISGQTASYRAAEKIFINTIPGKNAYIIQLQDNLDPDDFIKKYGPNGLRDLAESKIKISDYIFKYHSREIYSDDPNELAFFEKKLISLCNEIIDTELRKFYKSYFKNKIFNEIIRSKKYKKLSNELKVSNIKLSMPENEIREISFLNILIHYPQFSERKIEEISQLDLLTQNLNLFKDYFVKLLSSGQYYTKEILLSQLKGKYPETMDKIENSSFNKMMLNKFNENDFDKVFIEQLKLISKLKMKQKLKTIENKLIDSMDNKTLEDLRNAKKHNIS